MTKTIIRLEFEFWNLFVIWDLIFDIFTQKLRYSIFFFHFIPRYSRALDNNTP